MYSTELCSILPVNSQFVNPGFGDGSHPGPLRIARDEDNQRVA